MSTTFHEHKYIGVSPVTLALAAFGTVQKAAKALGIPPFQFYAWNTKHAATPRIVFNAIAALKPKAAAAFEGARNRTMSHPARITSDVVLAHAPATKRVRAKVAKPTLRQALTQLQTALSVAIAAA